MSEKNSWEKDFPETPESFRMALKAVSYTHLTLPPIGFV